MLTIPVVVISLVIPGITISSPRESSFQVNKPWVNASGVFWNGKKVLGSQGDYGDYDYYGQEGGDEATFVRSGFEAGERGDVININYHIHETVLSDVGENAEEKCLPTGSKCEPGVSLCCGDTLDTPDKKYCNPVVKKCLSCYPSVGVQCHHKGDVCCATGEPNEKLIFCLAKIGDKSYRPKLTCERITCQEDGKKCDGNLFGGGKELKNPCCYNHRCKKGTCEACRLRACSRSTGKGCCDSFWCDNGMCRCQDIGRPCSEEMPCCQNLNCVSGVPGKGGGYRGIESDHAFQANGGVPSLYRAEKRDSVFEATCAPRDGCATGKVNCTDGKVCINDICLNKCLKTGFECGVKGDHRQCCGPNERCIRTCNNWCYDHYRHYCQDINKQTTNCKRTADCYCKANVECSGKTCCLHDSATCKGRGKCFSGIYSLVFGPSGCQGGQNGAVNGGHDWSGKPGVFQPGVGVQHGTSYGPCPK